MAPTNTINQAELMAIQMVAEKLLELNITDSLIKIHTDSSTTLSRLTRGTTNSKQVINTAQKILLLQEKRQCRITQSQSPLKHRRK